MQNRFDIQKHKRIDDNNQEYNEIQIIDKSKIRDTLCLSEDMAGILLTTLFGDGLEPFIELLELYGLYEPEEK